MEENTEKVMESSKRESTSPGPGGIKDFIAQTNVIGNVITAAITQKNSFEPLPFTDYSLFEENYCENYFLLLFYLT
jgi:hypothetical protein